MKKRFIMIYFRIAQKHNQSSTWKWKSTILTSLETVFRFLRMYDRAPKDSFRVFFSSSAEAMNEMLHRENKGLASNSVTAQQLLNGEKRISILEVTRLESELGICENKRSAPNATIAEQSLNERKVSVLETTRLELEH